ncbi:hypothetical protein CDV31_016417 [Fusarium ambrosium]|uniref:EKC/KEOPS complex subunit BUD32 n=1 Tax=Fusarium ambrosium TaxID=131363 RepID=A0A428S9E7_9HYPO|nr:hypothetical protein CDV31_016417 [Fusarium ambrosium]
MPGGNIPAPNDSLKFKTPKTASRLKKRSSRLWGIIHVSSGNASIYFAEQSLTYLRFLGHYKPQGLKFTEADKGNLQQYIDSRSTIPLGTQARWFLQASEAIEYIHSKGVLHLDLRPENFLLYSQPNGETDLVLCDFGGSKYGDMYGGNLPDAGFYNPGLFHGEPSEAIDIFSLGSIFYNICSGHRPHQTREEDFLSYCRRVDNLFEREEFPPVDDLFAGSIIMKCWAGEYTTACLLLEDCRRLYTRSTMQ